MVNHVRTLLLNMSRAGLSVAGVPDGVPWEIDPAFRPAKLEPCVDAVLSSFGGGSSTPSDLDGILYLSRIVSGVAELADSPDCHGLFGWLDGRSVPNRGVDYAVDRGSVSVVPVRGTLRGMFARSAESGLSDGMAMAVVEAGGLPLFSKTGSRAVDDVLSEASGLYLGSFEWTVRLSAVVAAAVARLEFSRTMSGSGAR